MKIPKLIKGLSYEDSKERKKIMSMIRSLPDLLSHMDYVPTEAAPIVRDILDNPKNITYAGHRYNKHIKAWHKYTDKQLMILYRHYIYAHELIYGEMAGLPRSGKPYKPLNIPGRTQVPAKGKIKKVDDEYIAYYSEIKLGSWNIRAHAIEAIHRWIEFSKREGE